VRFDVKQGLPEFVVVIHDRPRSALLPIPALFTRMSMCPKARTASAHNASTAPLRERSAMMAFAPRPPAADLFLKVLQSLCERPVMHPGPFSRESPGDSLSDAPACAGNECRLPFEASCLPPGTWIEKVPLSAVRTQSRAYCFCTATIGRKYIEPPRWESMTPRILQIW